MTPSCLGCRNDGFELFQVFLLNLKTKQFEHENGANVFKNSLNQGRSSKGKLKAFWGRKITRMTNSVISTSHRLYYQLEDSYLAGNLWKKILVHKPQYIYVLRRIMHFCYLPDYLRLICFGRCFRVLLQYCFRWISSIHWAIMKKKTDRGM